MRPKKSFSSHTTKIDIKNATSYKGCLCSRHSLTIHTEKYQRIPAEKRIHEKKKTKRKIFPWGIFPARIGGKKKKKKKKKKLRTFCLRF